MLYLHDLFFKASPKAISRRTSYLRVRLEFLRYPQLIPCLFNDNEFGPPLDFTQVSAWPWIGHPVSGLRHTTISPYSDSVSLRLHTFLVLNLAIYRNSLDRSTKSTTSHLNVLCLLVNIGFQVLFHSPPGVLFTFPSRYFSTIGHRGVFSLGGWSPRLPTRFLVSRGTLDSAMLTHISLTRLSLSLVTLSNVFCYAHQITSAVLNPSCISTSGLGSFAFARRY